MANEDLFRSFALCQLLDQLDRVGDFAVETGVARFNNLARSIDRLAKLRRAEQPRVIVHFERKSQRIHLFVARPAVLVPSYSHPLAECVLRFIGQHGVDGDRHVGDATSQ